VPERFRSFDEAWRWFDGGGALVSAADSVEELTRGRAQLLAFIVPVDDAAVVGAAHALQDALADLDAVAPQPDELLHVTLRLVGFQVIAKRNPDELLPGEVDAIAADAARAFRDVRPAEVSVGAPNVFPDSLILEVGDAGALAAMRARVEEAVLRPPDEAPYLPHITVGAFRDPAVAAALHPRLAALRRPAPPLPMRVRRIELVRAWFTGLEAEPPELDVVRSYALRG
jgi:2'-5' RNA ligase